MYRQFIGKRDDSQEAPTKLIHSAPKTITIAPLKLCTNGRTKDSDAHVLGQVRSLAHDLIFKIWRKLIVRHASSILRTQHGRKNVMAEKEKLGGMFASPRPVRSLADTANGGRKERERVSQSARWRI